MSEPIQDGSADATRDEKVAGLISQVAVDLAGKPVEEVRAQLKLRLADVGIEADDAEVDRLADGITTA